MVLRCVVLAALFAIICIARSGERGNAIHPNQALYYLLNMVNIFSVVLDGLFRRSIFAELLTSRISLIDRFRSM